MRSRSNVTRMTVRRTLAGAAAAALSLVLSGCQDPATGIFHHLAHQQPTVDRNLANDITIGGVARWGDRYLVAAGKLWSRAVGTDQSPPGEWTSMTVTFDGQSTSAVMLPFVRWRPDAGEPSLLAGALFVDEERFALLQADAGLITANSVAWATVPGSEVNGREVIGLFTPDDDESVLFAVIAKSRGENRSYRLLSASRRSSGAPEFEVELDDLSHPVEAVATDGAGTYWAVAGSGLYTGSLGSLVISDTAPSPEGSETFRSVVHDGTGTLVLTGSTGTVWRSRDGGETWPDTHEIRADDRAVPLRGAVAVSSTALVGTDDHGYYTASLEGDLAVRRLPLTTEAIYRASILRLWVDPRTDGVTVFALTASDGLWSASVKRGEVPERWELE